MSKRAHGDGSMFWDEKRQRWVVEITIGYDGRGKRIKVRRYRRTKTQARDMLRELLRDMSDGVAVTDHTYTVGDAVADWLTFGLSDRDDATQAKIRTLCEGHIIPFLAARKLRDLKVQEVEAWLAGRADILAKSTLAMVKSYLNNAVRRAMAQDRVKRNVVELAVTPTGRTGRPSKSLLPEKVDAVLEHTRPDRLHGYIVVSLLTGARTEELRELRWDHVFLEPTRAGGVVVPPHIAVWRSVRKGGDTKTAKSRRTIALPRLCIDVLKRERRLQAADRLAAGPKWVDTGAVFTTRTGTTMDAANVRRDFRRALRLVPGITPEDWTPRELRHSFVSMLSDMGLEVDKIALLVGHTGGSKVTELVYRHQLRPVVQTGALAFDQRFNPASESNG